MVHLEITKYLKISMGYKSMGLFNIPTGCIMDVNKSLNQDDASQGTK